MKGICLGLAGALATFGAAHAGEVSVQVSGVQPSRGGVVYAVLQTREQFMQHAAAAGDKAAATTATAQLRFGDVPPGDYALSVLHDANGDRTMDYAPNGIPLEGWAMPGAERLNHRPSFDEVKITIPPAGAALSARMVYMDGKLPERSRR